MRAQTTILLVALAVLAVAAVPVAGLAATDGAVLADQHGNSTADNGTEDGNASVAPGERLSGVVGVQEAELEGEVDTRTFGIRVAQAATNESRAEVVAEQLGDVEQRLAALQQRKQELDEARANGSISEGTYRAEVSKLAAETQTAKELTNRSESATRGMPAALLESKGVNVTAIQTLKDRAATLTGPEVAEIARSIAGEAAPVDRGPGQAGPPQDRPGSGAGENATDDERGPDDAGPPEDGSGDGGPGEAGPDDGADDTEGTQTPTPEEDDAADSSDGEDSAGDGGSDGGAGNSDGGAGNSDGGAGNSDGGSSY